MQTSMPRSAVSAILLIFAACGSSGCAFSKCRNFDILIESGSANTEILEWADRWIFSKPLPREAFMMGQLAGPGRYGNSINLNRLGVALPASLHGAEVRVISDNRELPEAIFVGYRRFEGIVVGKNVLERSLAGTRIDAAAINGLGRRTAVMCAEEPGISPIPLADQSGVGGYR